MSGSSILWVRLHFACFGLVVDGRDQISQAPPIARYTLGWSAELARNYFESRNGTVVSIES